jgi:hypothetical protein
MKVATPLYKARDFEIEIENPYDQAGEFKLTIIESDTRNGHITNPYKLNEDSLTDLKLPTINDKKHGFRIQQTSKSSFESVRLEKLKEAEKKEGN